MIIEEIKRKGKSDKFYLITTSGKYLAKDETIYNFKIKKGEIDDDKFFSILKSSQNLLAFDEILNIVSRSYKTEKEIFDTLKKKGYIDEAIESAILKAKEYKYIDDNKYVQAYIDTYSKSKGKLLIKRNLLQKGISVDLIDKYLKEVEDDLESVVNIANKYLKAKQGQKNIKEKLYRFLLSKGYSYETISKVKNLAKEHEDESWD